MQNNNEEDDHFYGEYDVPDLGEPTFTLREIVGFAIVDLACSALIWFLIFRQHPHLR